MIPVTKPTPDNEPELFLKNCREPGAAWLVAHPDKDPHEQSDWWSNFKPDVARLFGYRCGWQATSIDLDGIVEHWLACGNRRGVASPNRHLAFEWTNYRYCAGKVNSRKGTLDDQILDPCDVQEGWFEVLLPSFRLVTTKKIPEQLRDKANFTLEQLQLDLFESRWTRWRWYLRYWNNGTPDLDGLRQDAPLVAIAVEKALAAQNVLPNPEDHSPDHEIRARKYPFRTRRKRLHNDPEPNL